MASFAPESPTATWHDETPIRIGVSSCLLGERVRWDGGHKRDAFLCEQLAPHVQWVSVCPEVELGLSVPRETLRLETRGGARHLVAVPSHRDLSGPMRRFSARRARALRRQRLCGFLLKSKSPSCGMTRVGVWTEQGQPERGGRGFFAEALLAADPGLAVEEESGLRDAALRERFVERIFAAHRLHSLFSRRWSRGHLSAFHAAHKLQLMAHTQTGARKLGALLAQANALRPSELRDAYADGFAAALSRPASRHRHTIVLKHVQESFRSRLEAGDRRELRDLIEHYRRGLVPLVAPVALLRHHLLREEIASLADQVYLDPHPAELMLRDHV